MNNDDFYEKLTRKRGEYDMYSRGRGYEHEPMYEPRYYGSGGSFTYNVTTTTAATAATMYTPPPKPLTAVQRLDSRIATVCARGKAALRA